MPSFTAFLDDSGTDPNQRVAISSALIIPTSRIVALEREWETLKQKEGFNDFHASAFVAKNEKAGFGGWSDEKQGRVFSRVRQITKKFGVKVFAFAVNKDDYDAVVPAELRRYSGKYHYTWAVRHIAAQVVAWRAACRVESPLNYVFDFMKERDASRIEIETVMKQGERVASEKGYPGEYVNYDFLKRESHAGLQCVDCVAWVTFHLGQFAFQKKPMHPLAQIAWDDFESRNSQKIAGPLEWISAATVTRDNLETWIKKETADGQTLQRFQRRDQEDKERT